MVRNKRLSRSSNRIQPKGPVLKKIGPQGKKGWIKKIPTKNESEESDTSQGKEDSLLWFLKH